MCKVFMYSSPFHTEQVMTVYLVAMSIDLSIMNPCLPEMLPPLPNIRSFCLTRQTK
jgi:hypothetical protein